MRAKNGISRASLAALAAAAALFVSVAPTTLLGQGSPHPAPPAQGRGRAQPPAQTQIAALPPPQIVITPQLAAPKEGGNEWTGVLAAIAWPLVVIGLAALVAWNRRLQMLLGLLPKFVTKISGPAGITVELTPEAAEKQRAYFEDSFDELMKNAKFQYDRMARACQVSEALKDLVNEGLPVAVAGIATVAEEKKNLRATVHVPDIVFEHFLYQLVDYYPGPAGKVGRRFSMRAGIIGRAWRLQKSYGAGNALGSKPATDSEAQWKDKKERELIEKWGMFDREAKADSKGRPSYLCIILKHGGIQGLLYLDSDSPNAFGDSEKTDAVSRSDLDKVIQKLEEHESCKRLASKIAEIMRPLSFYGPYLSVEQR